MVRRVTCQVGALGGCDPVFQHDLILPNVARPAIPSYYFVVKVLVLLFSDEL
jgi:hypothetical protein